MIDSGRGFAAMSASARCSASSNDAPLPIVLARAAMRDDGNRLRVREHIRAAAAEQLDPARRKHQADAAGILPRCAVLFEDRAAFPSFGNRPATLGLPPDVKAIDPSVGPSVARCEVDERDKPLLGRVRDRPHHGLASAHDPHPGLVFEEDDVAVLRGDSLSPRNRLSGLLGSGFTEHRSRVCQREETSAYRRGSAAS